MSITSEYERLHPKSAELYEQAREVFPDGVTHDTRRFSPFPLYVERALGPRKWDVDGNELIDYVSGHGALLLGHNHPDVVEAIQAQVTRGTHYGASHEGEIAWGRWVQHLIPSAERVRFTSSGTEAVQMAVRLARAFTRRELLVKFADHFHGWSDTVSATSTDDRPHDWGVGVPPASFGSQLVLPANDLQALDAAFRENGHRIAAIICEPTGAHMGGVPLDPEFLFQLRRVADQHGAVLIFDEVVTGFRVAPGGAQSYYSVTPDMTTLAKVLAGGLPGGAVAGKAEILCQMESANADGTPRGERVAHPGTFNANPVSSAAGVAALSIVATGDPHRAANRSARKLAEGMNAILRRQELPGCVYGNTSILHVLLGEECTPPADGMAWEWSSSDHSSVPHTSAGVTGAFRRAMINHGVDPMGTRLIVSAAHDDAAVEKTLSAFDATLAEMHDEGMV